MGDMGRLHWVTTDLQDLARAYVARQDQADLLLDMLGLGAVELPSTHCSTCDRQISISNNGRCRRSDCTASDRYVPKGGTS